jgi:hypothetical protein
VRGCLLGNEILVCQRLSLDQASQRVSEQIGVLTVVEPESESRKSEPSSRVAGIEPAKDSHRRPPMSLVAAAASARVALCVAF